MTLQQAQPKRNVLVNLVAVWEMCVLLMISAQTVLGSLSQRSIV